MNTILNRNLFLIKEKIGIFKASNSYDIFDPHSQELILTCREEKLGFFTKFFRFTDSKRITPFHLVLRTTDGKKMLSVKRGIALFLSTVHVFDEKEQSVGMFKQKFFSIGGKFNVLDTNAKILCSLKGKWTGWDFKFVKDNIEFAHVSKKWAGIGKELLTSADNYMLSIDSSVPADQKSLRLLILAAVMCIDMVLKE